MHNLQKKRVAPQEISCSWFRPGGWPASGCSKPRRDGPGDPAAPAGASELRVASGSDSLGVTDSLPPWQWLSASHGGRLPGAELVRVGDSDSDAETPGIVNGAAALTQRAAYPPGGTVSDRDLQAADHHNGHCQRHCGSLSEGTEPLIPIPVPIPDLPGIGGGGATPDLPGIGGPPPPQPPMILICVLGHCQCWHWALSDAD